MKHLRNAAILIGLAAYLVAFYATPMPSLLNDAGKPSWRFDLVFVCLFRPDDSLFSHWFGTPAQFALADRAPVLLAAGFILAWAAVLGWLALVICRVARGLTRLETAVFSTAVGLNLLSTWTLLVGLFGQLGRMRAVAAPALLTLATAACVWFWRRRSNRNSRGPLPSAYRRVTDVVGRRWLWLGLPFVLAILLAAMLPPTEFDVCEYHLQAPKEFFQQRQITFLPHNVYANMALGTEMLSLLGMTIAGNWWWGALVGKTVIAAFTPLCALALLAAGRRLYSNSAGVVAALVYISIPWLTSTAIPYVVNVSSSGLVEGASACYLFLALYALLLSGRPGAAVQLPSQQRQGAPVQPASQQDASFLRPAALVALSGYLAGGAVATKYPAALFVLVPLAFWTFVGRSWWRRGGADRRSAGRERPARDPRTPIPAAPTPIQNPGSRALNPFAALTVFLLAAAIGCGLWFGKNWAMTGNPTYPLLYGVFEGTTWTPDKEQQWNRVHLPHDFSIETLGYDVGRVLLTSEWISPLVVPLAFLAFFGWGSRLNPFAGWQRLRWELLAYAVFVVAVWWLLTHRIDRFWIPVLPVLALLAGAGACWNSEFWWRSVLKCLLLAGLLANFLVSSAWPGNAWFIPLDQLRNDSHWISDWHWYLNNDAKSGAILAVGDAAVFDLKAPVLYNTCFDDCVFERLVKGKTADEIRKAFASRHITYVLVDWSEIKRYRDTYGFTDFVQPEVFDRLVKEGILKQVPENARRLQKVYRVTL